VGAIGPLGIRIEPFGPTSKLEAQALFARQVQGLLGGGVDGFILETFSDMDEMHAALLAVRAATDLPVVCQMTVGTRRPHVLRQRPRHIHQAARRRGARM